MRIPSISSIPIRGESSSVTVTNAPPAAIEHSGKTAEIIKNVNATLKKCDQDELEYLDRMAAKEKAAAGGMLTYFIYWLTK